MSDEILDSAAPEADKPDNDADATGAPVQADEQRSGEESFTDFDPASIPESGASPQWLKEQYDHMRKGFTQKMQEFGETRRTKDQLQTIIDTLRQGDPEQRRATATMLGLTEDDVLQMFNLERAEEEAAAELKREQDPEVGDYDELEFKDPRVDRIVAREQQEAEQAEEQQREAEAEEYADEVGSEMEDQLKEALGGEPDEKVSKWIFAQALDNPDQFGKPDVIGAVAEWKELVESQVQERMDSRTGPRAPTPGIPGSERFDMSTDEGRVAAGAIAAREARSATR